MFERLFKNKKYLFLYVLAILAGFSNFGTNYLPISKALTSGMIIKKVPVLVPFVIMAIIQGVVFGKIAVLRFLIFTLLFAFLTSRKKHGEDGKGQIKNILIRSGISLGVTEAFLVLIGITAFVDIPYAIVSSIMTIAGSLIFEKAIEYILMLKKNNEVQFSTISGVAVVIMLVCVTTCLKEFTFFGIDLWSTITLFLLAIFAWKNKILNSIICAIIVAVTVGICDKIGIPLFIMIVLSTMVFCLISRAGKKGAIIGAFVCLVYALAISGHTVDVGNTGMSNEMMKDYVSTLKKTLSSMQDKSGEEYQKIATEISRIEEVENIKEQAKNTTTIKTLKEMVIVFAILSLIPEKYIEDLKGKVSVKNEFKFIQKFFKNNKIYRLNAGK